MRRVALLASGQIEGDGMAATATLPLPLMLWGLLMAVDWRIGMVIAAFAPLAAWTVPWSSRLLDKATQRAMPARDTAAERVIEPIEGAQELRMLDPTGSRRRAAEEAIRELEARSVATELAPAPAILLFGVAVSFVMTACGNMLILFADQCSAASVLFWTLGGFGASDWPVVPIPAITLALGGLWFLLKARDLMTGGRRVPVPGKKLASPHKVVRLQS